MATEEGAVDKSMVTAEVMRLFMEDRGQWEAEMQTQLQLLRTLVEETRGPTTAEVSAVVTASRDVRLPKLTKDDIESYLTIFERMMAGYESNKGGGHSSLNHN